ncbi:TonB-dependent receptor [Mucilaginibacter sp. OK283]|uniref:TonB-dependent receptor n=1 Tax=Mucilaginibacter sp. OK283 TaxID=1881049 RepID=UPI0008B80E1D|nr:TonB-dependent receptor [Mucilaginibacter sp. OK283]SEO58517.1 TonB-linked outer membrane protein, SusC/RagA family [Mucilaginibacter sp. OK283]
MKKEILHDKVFSVPHYRKFLLMLNWTFVLTFLFCLNVSANSYSQNVKVSLNLKDASLRKAINTLEQKGKTRFLYSEQLLPQDKQVTLDVNNVPLLDVLNRILENTGLDYQTTDNGLVIIALKGSVIKNIQVKGRVLDDKGSPLPGVSVKVLGTNGGAVTNGNGEYDVSVPEGASLVFSYIGYLTQTVEVGTKTQINVVLKTDEASQKLSEVIVVGYGTQRKSDLTGSVASISGKDLDKTPVLGADQMLQGRVSGLQLTQSDGQPGSATSIRIRGTNSINSGNEPLYVVDGFAGVGNLTSINPNDIQSIEVLKDASATAIYGSRGANGVILITTKKGKAGQHAINFESYAGVQRIARKLPLMDATQFGKYLNEYYTEYNAANPATAKALPYTDDQIAGFGKGTDWQNALYRTAPIQNYQLSFNGGTNEARYYLSLNHFDQDGIMRATGFRRELVRLNLDRNIGKKIKMGFSSQISYNVQAVDPSITGVGYGAAGGALSMSPITPLRDASGAYTFANAPAAYVGTYGNPVAAVELATDRIANSRGLINTFGEYEFIPGFKFKSSFGVDYNTANENSYLPTTIYIGQQTGGTAYSSNNTSYSWLNENTLSFNKQFNKIHVIDAVAGVSLQEFKTKAFSSSAQGFFTDNLGTDNLALGANVLTPQSNKYRNTIASYFGRINYRLMEKYLFTFTMRSDGSSRFGATRKWGYFPSGAFAWRASEEKFIKNIKQISDLKIRASYGVTGNQEIGSYQSLSQYGINSYTLGTSATRVVGVQPNNIANPKLSWESTASFDVGADMGLFNNRISLTADYYHKTTSDLLLNFSIPQSSGFSSILLNAGKVENHGIEFSLTTRNIESRNFNWNTTLTYAANRNKVLDMNGTNNILVGNTGPYIATNGLAPSILRVGQPIGSFYGYHFDGIYQTQAQIAAAGISGVVPGDAIIRDVDGNKIIDGNDRQIIGQAAPKFIFSINNTLSYKNFDLSIFAQGVQGNKVLNLTSYAHSSGTTANVYSYMANAWNGAGSTNTVPRVLSTSIRNAGVVDNYLEDGSYLRIQTISLGYNIPVSPTSRVFKTSTVYVTVQNVHTFTKYTGYNPEINSFGAQNLNAGTQNLNPGSQNLNLGADVNSYPPPRTFLLGVKIGF